MAEEDCIFDVLTALVGGGVGSVACYFLSLVPWKTVGVVGFPLVTLVTNVVGSFGIGIIVGLAAQHGLSPRAVLFAKTGICGGFTTFSTFALETTGLFDRGEYFIACAYMVLSFALGVAACIAGQAMVGSLQLNKED